MYTVWITPISIFLVFTSLMIIPIYASSIEFSLTIENIHVMNGLIVDFNIIPIGDKVIITNVTKTQLIKIPSNFTDARIIFQGDAMTYNTVTLQNDITIDAKNMNAIIEMKNQTTISNNAWNGEFIFVKINNEQITNQENVVSFQFGNDKVSLEFSPPVKLTFKDSANKNVFITSPGQGRVQITTVCNSADIKSVNVPTTYPQACYINVGNDLVVFTEHASVFSTSNNIQNIPTTQPSPKTSQKSSSGGGGGRINVNTNQLFGPTQNDDLAKSYELLINQWLAGTAYDRLFYAMLNDFANTDLIILKQTSFEQSYPLWLKVPSQWWIDGEINDEEYINALQWLIDNELIVI